MNNVVFFGSGPYVEVLLDALRKKFDIALIVTTEKESGKDVARYARENSISLLCVEKFDDENIQKIQEIHAEVAVLAFFGIILPSTVLNLFPKGIINIHPSLLPEYRGPTPIQTPLLEGDTTSGTSIIKLDEEVDHGPLLASETISITPEDDNISLHTKLFALGAKLILDALPKYLSGELMPHEQNHLHATFTTRLTRNDGFIDSTTPPFPEKLERMIRAYNPWPGVWSKVPINGTERIIKLFPHEKIQVEGKKVMSYKDFINGYSEGKEILERLNLQGNYTAAASAS